MRPCGDVRAVPQPQPEPQASSRVSHWADKVEHARRKAFVRRHLPDETQQSGADALVQMDRAADTGLATAVSSMGGSPRESTATERAQFFVEDHNANTSGKRITKALQATIFEKAAAMDGDDPDDARGRRAALIDDRGAGPVFTKPFDAASYMSTFRWRTSSCRVDTTQKVSMPRRRAEQSLHTGGRSTRRCPNRASGIATRSKST